MDVDDAPGGVRRMPTRSRKVAPKMAAALASADNRAQAALARLEALESDNAVPERVDLMDDEDDVTLNMAAHLRHVYTYKKQLKRKTRQAEALERARTPRTFMELLHEANLEALPPHVPSYIRAAVGPPSSTSRRHFCSVCGSTANYTCVRCGMRFCSCRCQVPAILENTHIASDGNLRVAGTYCKV